MGRSRRATKAEERLYKEVLSAPVEYIDHPTLGRIATIDTKAARKRAGVSSRTTLGTVFQ